MSNRKILDAIALFVNKLKNNMIYNQEMENK